MTNLLRKLTGALLLLASLPAAAQTPRDSAALAQAEWQTTDLGGGAVARRTQTELFGTQQTLSVAIYPRRGFSTLVVQPEGAARATSRLGEEAGADIAINGSYFHMKSAEPITFVLSDGEIRNRGTMKPSPLTNGVAAVRGRKGRRVEILPCDTADYPRIARRYRSALAAGPMLVHEGEILNYDTDDTFYTGRHPRSVIGTRSDGSVVLLVIDGRFPGRAAGATIAETAYIARQLGLTEALNLDGGGSSSLWTRRLGVLNHPTDNKRFDHEGERAVPNGIVVFRR